MNELTQVPIQVYLSDNVPVVTSRNVAEYFHKSHKNVLRDIDNLISDMEEIGYQSSKLSSDIFNQNPKLGSDSPLKLRATQNSKLRADSHSKLNAMGDSSKLRRPMFQEITYRAGTGKAYREFEMTRDGFTLLAMGFTGKEALGWKLKYIDAFNRMEEYIKGGGSPLPDAACKEELPPLNRHAQAAVRAIGSLLQQGYTTAPYVHNSKPVEPFLGFDSDTHVYIRATLLHNAYRQIVPESLSLSGFYQILADAGLIDRGEQRWISEKKNGSRYIYIRHAGKKTYRLLRFKKAAVLPYLLAEINVGNISELQ